MTTNPTLPIKLSAPSQSDIYPRLRLHRLLDATSERPMIWIAAAPGSGKTALVTDWLQQHKQRAVWYQLDSGDSDPATFFHYMNLATASLVTACGATLPTFTPEHLPTLGNFARQWFARLGALITQATTFVFDNYQEVTAESPLHELLAGALPLLPAHGRIVILSHAEPPAAYARLLVNRQIATFDTEALRLDETEAVEMASRLGYSFEPVIVKRLNGQAMGWVAGLLLLLEHLRGSPNSEPAVMTGQVLFNYFAGEVLRRMPAHDRDMLLQLAFLPVMNANFTRELTGDDSAAALIEHLARRHWFTQQHAGADADFQFHPLFRSYLLAQARADFPAPRLAEIQARAAHLLSAQGRFEDAVGLLRDAANWPALAQLTVRHAPQLARQGRLHTLLTWIDAIPETVRAEQPWLLYWHGMVLLTSRPLNARGLLVRAFELFDRADDPAGLYLAWSGTVNSYAMAWSDFIGLDPWIEIFETLRKRFPAISDPAVAARVTFGMIAVIMHRCPDHANADYWLDVATKTLAAITEPTQRLMIGSYLVIFRIWRGEMREASFLVESLEPLALDADLAPAALLFWSIASAMHAWSSINIERALAKVRTALQLTEDSGLYAIGYRLCMHAVYANLTANDIDGAQTWARQTESAIRRSGRVDPSAFHHMYSLLHLHAGNGTAAKPHAEKGVEHAVTNGNVIHEALGRVCLGHIHLTLGEIDACEIQTARALDIATRARLRPMVTLCEMNRALIALERDNLPGAVDALRHALALSVQMGGMGNPFFVPRTLTRLYRIALEHDVETEHVRTLIRRLGLHPDAESAYVEKWPWRVRIYTLGRFAVTVDGERLDTDGNAARKPLALLKVLIALGGREVSLQRLIDELWPDTDGDAGRQAFDTALHRLRKLFGADAPLTLKHGALTLDAHRCWVDVWALERLLSTLHTAERDSDFETLFDQSFALYQGSFLGSGDDTPGVLTMRERLSSRFIRGMLHAAQHHESRDRADRAERCYTRLLEIEPAVEDAWLGLVRLHQRQGRHAEAMVSYRRCERVFEKLLGTPPSFTL